MHFTCEETEAQGGCGLPREQNQSWDLGFLTADPPPVWEAETGIAP